MFWHFLSYSSCCLNFLSLPFLFIEIWISFLEVYQRIYEDFWLICNGPEGDKFFGVEGTVEIKNIESGRVVLLNEDAIVLSNSNGNILTQNMSTQDLEQIENLDL